MQEPKIGVTAEGAPSIVLTAFSALIFALIGCWFMAVFFLLLCWFAGHFFRDPERIVPLEKDIAVSPADGKIIKISDMPDPFSGEPRKAICIFMNVFSVHVNRAPVSGQVKDIAYHPGKFFNAAWDKASRDNERCSYLMEDAAGQQWSFVQIAGLIARRIVCRAEIGDNLARGERLGMIKFGSRVDVYLPEGYEANVNIGEQVFAGQSIIARRQKLAEE